MRISWVCLSILASVLLGVSAAAQAEPVAPATACDPAPVRSIPARASGAPTGSQFARRVEALTGAARDALVRSELLSGNVPEFLRHLVPITLESGTRPSSSSAGGAPRTRITVCVLPDYLALGTNSDFLLVPMGLKAALDVARRFGFELPTPKLVDAIYATSAVKLMPQPLPAGDQMRSTAYFVRHDELIEEQRSALDAPLGELTAGHKKDLVLTSRLWEIPGRVAIYGWHRAEGEPIQPLSTWHGARYSDYSHGVRLVSNTVFVNGQRRSLAQVLAEPALAELLTYEGPMRSVTARLARLTARLAAEEQK